MRRTSTITGNRSMVGRATTTIGNVMWELIQPPGDQSGFARFLTFLPTERDPA